MSPKPDVMTILTEARPAARLDPVPDELRRQRDLSLALAGRRQTRTRRLLATTAHRQTGLGLAAAAGVAAVATVIASGGLGTGTTPGATGSPARGTAIGARPPAEGTQNQLSAAQILLLAAHQVQAAAPTTGRYWLERSRYVDHEQVGPAGHKYLVKTQARDDTWTARSPRATSWWISQELGAAPAGPSDEAAWKRDGSPASWQISVAKTGGTTARLTIDAKGGKPFGNPSNEGALIFAVGNRNVSMADLQRLPADPAALKALLVKNFHDGGTGGDLPSTENAWLFRVAGNLLEMPVKPGVRAAAYRLIAGLHGVRALGSTTDLDGRTGNGVAIRETDVGGLSEDRIIIQPGTGLPLAEENAYLKPTGTKAWLAPGQVWYAHLVESIGWTNATPPKLPKSGS